MGNCWKQKAKDYYWAQVGEVCGKSSAYAKEMDAIHFYNYPKNGAANSCALFYDNGLLHACTDPSYDNDPEGAKWTALSALYEPQTPGANAGAGCVQKVGYYRRAGAYYTDPADFCELDQIFFASPDYISDDNPEGLYHTGAIVDWGYIEELGKDGFTTIEGNTTYEGESGRVAYKYYAYDDPRIHGAGRPNWDGWEPGEEKTQEKPAEPVQPTPEPTTPTPKPEPEHGGAPYVVRVNSFLMVRDGPGVNYRAIWKLYNGDRVTIYEEQDGWGRIDDYGWVCMEYLAPIFETKKANYKVRTNSGCGLRLRAAPNTESAILALIPNGTEVQSTESRDGWARTSYAGSSGWACLDYLVEI